MPTDAMPLRERFTQGLDAPICLTWELTYACNLACVHCLSSSGRRDPMELTPAEARHVVDELADMKVFYVNIGGGEPMLRPDFFDLVGLRRRQEGRGQVLHQRHPAHRRAGPPPGRDGLRRRADQHRWRPGVDQRLGPRRGVVRRGQDRHGQPGGGELRPVQNQRGGHSRKRHAARPILRDRRKLRRPAQADEVPPLRPRCRDLGPAPPDGRAAADAVPLAARATRCPDGRFLLPPLGSGRRRSTG